LLAWITSQRGDLKTKINQCELSAVVAAVMTFPDILLERDVVFWVDNTTALSACVDGYSNFPDLATLSNALHLLLAGLRTRSYFLHVPGKANCADIPSRVPFVDIAGQQVLHPFLLSKVPADKLAIDGINASHRPMLFPSRDQLNQPAEFLLFGDSRCS
jgi:hypothetical protein